MTSFDASGMGGAPPQPAPQGWGDQHQQPAGEAVAVAAPPDEPFDSLALLRAAVSERVEIEPVTIPVPTLGIRLVCHTDITSKQLGKWQKAALPPHVRKTGNGSALDMDQMQLAVAVLVGTLLRIEVADPKKRGEWLTVEDSRTGEPLTFSDGAVLNMFGAIDTVTALKRLFGRDSGVVKAGRVVLNKAGWGDDEMVADEAEDPELDPM